MQSPFITNNAGYPIKEYSIENRSSVKRKSVQSSENSMPETSKKIELVVENIDSENNNLDKELFAVSESIKWLKIAIEEMKKEKQVLLQQIEQAMKNKLQKKQCQSGNCVRCSKKNTHMD